MLLDELDGMLKRGEVRQAKRWNQKVLLALKPEDKETVLMAANERWTLNHHSPRTHPTDRENWHVFFRNEVVYGQGITPLDAAVLTLFHSFEDGIRYVITGNPPDVRDAGTIARQFLDRVDQLAALPGGDDLGAVVARARDEVLDGVPKGYRKTVLERVLDLESERLRERGADAAELEALEKDRDSRRERGWSALIGKDTGERRR